MGTRGFVTFVIDGREKTAYRHSDAYPECFGLAVLRWLRTAAEDPVLLAGSVRALRAADPGSSPTAADVRSLRRFAAGDGEPRSWYWLLRQTQDDPALMLEAGVIEDAGEFPRSPQARWGYVIDADACRFEVYRAAHAGPHALGRFSGLDPLVIGGTAFYPPALAASWPFGKLPADAGEFADACYRDDE